VCWGATIDKKYTVQQKVVGSQSKAKVLAVGGSHACALSSAGGVMCWGENVGGQLGNGTNTNSETATPVKGLRSGVTAIAVGMNHACALLSSGGVKCWGDNQAGQLGDGSLQDRNTPTQVVGLMSDTKAIDAGGDVTCALMKNGKVKCWGDTFYGQLGDASTTSKSVPTQVSGLDTSVRTISVGSEHVCAELTTGSATCWGNNSGGQLGDRTTGERKYPVEVASGRKIDLAWTGEGCTRPPSASLVLPPGDAKLTAIALSAFRTCAVTSTGAVLCWGPAGEPVTDDVPKIPFPTQVQGLDTGTRSISMGRAHACALTAAGAVKCWGNNLDGRLNDGTRKSRWIPSQVPGLESGIIATSSNSANTCVLTSAGGAKCWGSLGVDPSNPTAIFRNAFTPIPGLESGLTAIATGNSSFCVLTKSGAVKCVGSNGHGELGNGKTTDSPVPVQVAGLDAGVTAIANGEHYACAITSEGAVKCWGSNTQYELGDGTTVDKHVPTQVKGLDSGVTAISTGDRYACAIMSSGEVKCWGTLFVGGIKDMMPGIPEARLETRVYAVTSTRTYPVPERVGGLESNAVAVAAGNVHACVVLANGGARCWGDNSYGQLGDNSPNSSATPVKVVGFP